MAISMNNHVFKGHKTLLGSRYVTYGELELLTRYEIFPKSNNGFDWGTNGSSAIQLAFAMLYQVSQDKEISQKYAISFVNTIVGKFSRDWIYSANELQDWMYLNCEEITKEKKAPVIIKKIKKIESVKKIKKQKTNVVKEICKELKITQKKLAEILEVPEGTVSSWAVKNEIPRLGKKAIEFYILSVKNQKIIDTYRSFKELLEVS